VNRQAGLAQKLLEIFMRGVEQPLQEAVCTAPTEYLAAVVVGVESSMGEILSINPLVVVCTPEQAVLIMLTVQCRGAVVAGTHQTVKQAMAGQGI